MLQQTQVKTVLPRYAAWFKHFPTIRSLAAVSLDEVLKVWEGLGYYRRARFIHQAAQLIVNDRGGSFPTVFDDIISLPGIGQSTAGAISSICFNTATPVLDGNVKRVLKRWHAQADATDKQLWLMAQQEIEISECPANWNQAMMELGATICRPKSTSCGVCPVSGCCASAFQADRVKTASKPVPVHDVHWQVRLHVCPVKGIWLARRPDSGIWASLWTPPIIELDEAPVDPPCHVHLLTHRRLHLYGRLSSEPPRIEGRWVKKYSNLALPTGIHRLLEKYGIQT
jgi:A/G-specific adenine glycosylase